MIMENNSAALVIAIPPFPLSASRKSSLPELPLDLINIIRLCLYKLAGNRQISKSLTTPEFFHKMRRKFTNANSAETKKKVI